LGDDLETSTTIVEEGDFAPAGSNHSQEWLLRRKSLNGGAGVEGSVTDYVEEGLGADGVAGTGDELDADGDYDGDGGAEWADIIDDAVDWADSDTAEADYGTNNWIPWRENDITNPNSVLYGAVQRVQEMAVNDPNANQLLATYSASSANLQQAVAAAKADPSLDNFLALRLAQDQNTTDKANVIMLDAQTTGDYEEQRWAEGKLRHADADKQTVATIMQLPPDQRQAAMDKLAQDNPRSPFVREYNAYKNGDFSQYQNTQTTLTAQAAPQQTSSNTSDYGDSSYWDYMSTYSFSNYWTQNPLSGSSGTFNVASAGTTTTTSSPTVGPTPATRPTNTAPTLA